VAEWLELVGQSQYKETLLSFSGRALIRLTEEHVQRLIHDPADAILFYQHVQVRLASRALCLGGVTNLFDSPPRRTFAISPFTAPSTELSPSNEMVVMNQRGDYKEEKTRGDKGGVSNIILYLHTKTKHKQGQFN